jgi:hypothetical protein
MSITLYNGPFEWENDAPGIHHQRWQCHLNVFNLDQVPDLDFNLIRPIALVATMITANDQPGNTSIRSFAHHIVTKACTDFHLDPTRVLFVEHVAPREFGGKRSRHLPARFFAGDFRWHNGHAMYPHWQELEDPLKTTIQQLLDQGGKPDE